MTKQEQFFYDNAGFSYDPRTETWEQGREKCAKRLAEAETYATAQDWTYEWMPDHDDCGDGDETPNVREACLLYDGAGEVLQSLWSIHDADSKDKRVIEAELALEAMAVNTGASRQLQGIDKGEKTNGNESKDA